MNFPYIGITDFASIDQVQRMLSVFNRHKKPGSNRILHIGVMMSFKTLNDIPSKWSGVFPAKDKIANIFEFNGVMNCLHYASSRRNDNLWQQLLHAIKFGGMGITALQLDISWPEPGEIANGVHASRKNLEVILQVGTNAFEEARNDPQEVVGRLQEYEGVIDHVLLDKSMGRGVGMDAVGLIPFISAIKTALPNLGVAVAGGLGPETMHLVEPLVREFPDISIDAQGKLRPSSSALDPIDWTMAESYLIRALELLD